MPATYRNASGRIAYEADPVMGGGLYTWPFYVEFSGNDDPLLMLLLERVRHQIAERMARDGPGELPLA